MRRSPIALAMILAAGCQADPAPNAAAPNAQTNATAVDPPAPPAPAAPGIAEQGPALAIEGEGLRLFDRETGSARPIPFGTAQAQTLAALAFRGPPGTGTNSECGAGPLDYANWPDGLSLLFQDGKFAGWSVDARSGGAITTANGVGTGMTRAALEGSFGIPVTVSETTLGDEFTAGALRGLLDGPGQSAKVTNIWAGVSCNFR